MSTMAKEASIPAEEREILTQELRRSEAYLAEAQRLSHTGSFGWKTSNGEWCSAFTRRIVPSFNRPSIAHSRLALTSNMNVGCCRLTGVSGTSTQRLACCRMHRAIASLSVR